MSINYRTDWRMQTKKTEVKFEVVHSQVNTQFCNILFFTSETLEYKNATLMQFCTI
jgi:hypothetical protein